MSARRKKQQKVTFFQRFRRWRNDLKEYLLSNATMLRRIIKRALKLILTVFLAYLLDVCAMPYLRVGPACGSVLFAVLAVFVVSYGKVYGYLAACIAGILMESALSNVPIIYLLAYPIITMLLGQFFADRSERQVEEKFARMAKREERRRIKGKAVNMKYAPVTDLKVYLRIPVLAGLMELLMNVVLCFYLSLIDTKIGFIQISAALLSAIYTAAVAAAVMLPLRWFLNMYPKKKRDTDADGETGTKRGGRRKIRQNA